MHVRWVRGRVTLTDVMLLFWPMTSYCGMGHAVRLKLWRWAPWLRGVITGAWIAAASSVNLALVYHSWASLNASGIARAGNLICTQRCQSPWLCLRLAWRYRENGTGHVGWQCHDAVSVYLDSWSIPGPEQSVILILTGSLDWNLLLCHSWIWLQTFDTCHVIAI